MDEQQIREDLKALAKRMEAGEVPWYEIDAFIKRSYWWMDETIKKHAFASPPPLQDNPWLPPPLGVLKMAQTCMSG